MIQTRILMGMPITVEIIDVAASEKNLALIFSYFEYIDEKFSTYKAESEITKINNKLILYESYSEEMKTVLKLCEETKQLTNGYFDILKPDGKLDPSGLVKGWAIYNASQILKQTGFKNFYVEAGGDVQTFGKNSEGKIWSVGIKNPFNQTEIIKALKMEDKGVATSGTYIRGQHIYNPKKMADEIKDIVSLTVIGPNIYEADRFATAAFAMGIDGINFIEKLDGFEGYIIDKNGIATQTSNFESYVLKI